MLEETYGRIWALGGFGWGEPEEAGWQDACSRLVLWKIVGTILRLSPSWTPQWPQFFCAEIKWLSGLVYFPVNSTWVKIFFLPYIFLILLFSALKTENSTSQMLSKHWVRCIKPWKRQTHKQKKGTRDTQVPLRSIFHLVWKESFPHFFFLASLQNSKFR